MPRGVYARKKTESQSDAQPVVVERVAAIEAPEKGPQASDVDAEMNALALRIWDGQGSIALIERVERIVTSLKAKGYDTANLVLPDPGFKKYIK